MLLQAVPNSSVNVHLQSKNSFDVQHLPGAVASGVKAVVEWPPLSLCNSSKFVATLRFIGAKLYKTLVLQKQPIYAYRCNVLLCELLCSVA